MTSFKTGEILLVPFPFSEQKTIKKRPAVIISSNPYNNRYLDLIIMAITSQTEIKGLGEVLIEDWKTAGLLKPSLVKPAISTIEQKLVLKRLGTLSPKDLISLNKALSEILFLSGDLP